MLLRHLGVADFGRYGTVIALVAIASGLADAGLNMTGSRELALLPRGSERRRLLGALLGARLLLLLAAAAGRDRVRRGGRLRLDDGRGHRAGRGAVPR